MATECESCRYFVERSAVPRNSDALPDGFGECRRRAPQGMAVHTVVREKGSDDGSYVQFSVSYPFPPVFPKDWCGEFVSWGKPDGPSRT